MGSARASTSAGRRRATRRAGDSATGSAPRPAAKRASSPGKPKRAAPRPRKAAPKPRKTASKARKAASLRSRAPTIALVALVVLGLLAAGYQLWFRNSSLVAVERVSVSGIGGPEQAAVEAALTEAAGEMTTLSVDEDALRAAVAGFATVVGVEADSDFPHDLAISVTERPPVLIATSGGQELPVAGDGTVLGGVEVDDLKLPTIGVAELPAQGKLTGDALAIATVVGAAPEPLRELIEDISMDGVEGVEVALRGSIPVYFGTADDAAAKWAAAAAVLADPKIKTLTYVDVRVAGRPAVGGAAPAVTDSTTETTVPETGAAP